MSLSLLLFRHAESELYAKTDHARLLTEKGKQQARFMGELISEKSLAPALIICSTAIRARTTMELAFEAGQWESDINISDLLYETTPGTMLQLIQHFSEQDKVVMLVGHEPTWSELATGLTNIPVSFRPAGICQIDFDCDEWKTVQVGSGQFKWYEHP